MFESVRCADRFRRLFAVDAHQVGEEVRRFLDFDSHLDGYCCFSLAVFLKKCCRERASFDGVVGLRPNGFSGVIGRMVTAILILERLFLTPFLVRKGLIITGLR